MHRESGYERYKEPEGVEMTVRKAIGIQLYGAAHTAVITGLMRAVTLGGQNTMIQWRLTFIRFLICNPFKHCLPAGLLGTQVALFTFHSCILYSAEGYQVQSNSVLGARLHVEVQLFFMLSVIKS